MERRRLRTRVDPKEEEAGECSMASASATDGNSAAASQRWSYDVFLSFKAEDTGNTFTGFIYSNLRQRGINTYIHDRNLVREEEITPSVLKSIEESRLVLVVFSQNYASSTWCLDELAKAVDCSRSKNGQVLIPIFYRIDPSHVRKQKDAVEVAMKEHEIKFKNNPEKVRRWRNALFYAANLSGRHLDDGHEPDFVETIAQEVSTRIFRPRYVPKNLVGVDYHLNKLKILLNLGAKDAITVGIYGTGGVGKTTIAEVLYNSVAETFQNRSFLASVRDISKQHGLVQLQEKLLSDTLGKSTGKLGSTAEGIEQIRYKLQNKKVLIVLDDVDSLNQLEALSGSEDWFGPESRIIITTRDRHLLVMQGVERTHKINELNDEDALELVSRNAFGSASPPKEFEQVSSNILNYAEGLPLAVAILGKFLRGRSVIEWESKIESLETFLDQEIYKVLKVSFDGLANDEKAIFLDIACFFNGKKKDYAMEVLKSCHSHPDLGIRALTDKSLINVDSEKLHMHHLLQQMGREIVRQESQNPGKRSRLWCYEDVLRVLEQDTGTDAIEGIVLDLPRSRKRIQFHDNAFLKMKRLRLLIINNLHFHGNPTYLSNELRWLEWSGYPSRSMPTEFRPRNLVGLKLSLGRISKFWWVHSKSCLTLASLELTRCGSLVEIPDVSTIPNLRKLIIVQCSNLVMVHDSVGFLDKLVHLEIVDCSALKRIPTKLRLISLEELLLMRCSKLKDFPDISGQMKLVRLVNLSWTGIKKLPRSIKNLTGLKFLDLGFCKNLEQLPSSIYSLQNLEVLILEGCTKIHEISLSNNGISRGCGGSIRKLSKLGARCCSRRKYQGLRVGAQRLGLGLRLKPFNMKRRRTRNGYINL